MEPMCDVSKSTIYQTSCKPVLAGNSWQNKAIACIQVAFDIKTPQMILYCSSFMANIANVITCIFATKHRLVSFTTTETCLIHN